MRSIKKAILLMCSASLSLVGCASHELVRPGVKGIHTVTTYGENPDTISRIAMSQATNYCEEVEKSPTPYILAEKKSFKSSKSEKDYKMLKTGGGIMSSSSNGLFALGGMAAKISADGGYSNYIKFTCHSRLSAKR